VKILTSYFHGFVAAYKTKKMITTIYIITLFLALIIAIPFGNTIEEKGDNSMAYTSLLKDFDYAVYRDFMNQYSGVIDPFISIAIWTGIFYILFTIFFEGGIFIILIRNVRKYSLKTFWEVGARYFSRFFRLAVYSVLFQVIAALAVYITLSNILDSAYYTADSEASLFYIAFTGVLIHTGLFILILTITDYAKIMMIEDKKHKPFKTFFKSFGFVFRHFFSTYFLYLILLIVPVSFFIIYFWLEAEIGMSSGIKIFVIFIIQQTLIWCRIFIKIWVLGSELILYNELGIKEEPVKGDVVFDI
jgi:hypothetical protein